MQLSCVNPGGGALLVDHGRPGQRSWGVPSSGPADRRAAKRAREILDLPPDAVLLETTLNGGQWLLTGKGQIVFTGADMNWKINGRPAEAYTTIDLEGDYLLDGSFATRGCRSYLGIRGAWKVPKTLGSVSPGLPGNHFLEPGWSVEIEAWEEADYTSDLDPYQHCPHLPLSIPVIPGPEWDWLPANLKAALVNQPFQLGKKSNRQGARLVNDHLDLPALLPADMPALISSPVLPGTVQLAPAGPMILLHDAHTLGGFPRILLGSDLEAIDAIGQLKTGDEVVLNLSA